MQIITASSLSQTIERSYQAIHNEGIKQPTRNGHATAIFDTTFEFTNPRARHLNLAGRKSNIFQLIAETFWVMAGANTVSPYLDFFLPRAVNYSDDGVTWHGAYGPRMYAYSQMADVVNTFKTDGINTRRAFISIGTPEHDSGPAIRAAYGDDHVPKDIPCNRELHFYVEDGTFHTKHIQRSGDLLFGTGSINPFEFSFLHELMFNEIEKIYPGQITLGSYRWHVTNAHVYSDFDQQVSDVLSSDQVYRENEIRLLGPDGGVNSWENFFGELISHFGYLITIDEAYLKAQITEHTEALEDILHRYGIRTGLMREYAFLTLDYIISKRLPNTKVVHDITPLLEGDLLDAVMNSGFRKFILSE